MGALRDKANLVYVDGPSASPAEPPKQGIRELFGMVEDTISSVAEGTLWTPNTIRVRSTANVNLANGLENGDTLNGVVLATGNHVFLGSQSTASQNGIYTVVASGAASRASFANTAAELAHIGFVIQEGTDGAGERWTLPLDEADIVVGSTSLVFALIGIEVGYSAEVAAARQGLDSLNHALDMARNTAFTEVGDQIFDPMTAVFRSGRIGVEAPFLDNAVGQAMPFDWDGTRFDYVKVWVMAAFGGTIIRVGIWSADKSTLHASGYVQIFRTASPNHVWVKLDRPMRSAVASAGVLYLSVDGISTDVTETTLNRMVGFYGLYDRDAPNLTTYPLLYTNYLSPNPDISAWTEYADGPIGSGGMAGIPFELYNSYGTAKRGMAKSDPRADEIVMTPRLCGIVGTEMNVYLRSLLAGRKEKAFHATGISVGRQLSERWTMTPAAPLVGGTLTVKVIDADDYFTLDTETVTIDAVAQNAAAAATRLICAMGDSTTAGGQWQQRVLDKAAANVNGVQPTFQGTKGSGLLKNEAVGGRRLLHFYQPTTVPLAADNPFVTGVNQYFDAEYYMSSNPTFSVPEIVVWHLGLNESIAQVVTSETTMLAVAGEYCRMLAEMIGVQASANPVVPWSDVDANIKHIVALPIATGTQDGFGVSLYAGLNYQEGIMHRYCHILRNRIVKVFGNSEGDGIFLMPWHVTNDPINSFIFVNEPWNVNTTRTVDRAQDAIHPHNVALGGYQQMGDSAWGMLNVGVAKGWF